MFDCAWTDPSHETVGQRRERKARQDDARSRRSSMISSNSSSSISTSHSPVAVTATAKNARSTFSNVRFPSLKLRTSSSSANSTKAQGQGPEHVSATSPRTSRAPPRLESTLIDNTDQIDRSSIAPTASLFASSDSSNLSDDAKPSSRTTSASTWTTSCESICRSREIQSLSAGSFITRSTEVSVCPVEEIAHLPVNEVHISVEVPPIKEEEHGSESECSPVCYQFPPPPNSPPMLSDWNKQIRVEGLEGGPWRPPEDWESPASLKNSTRYGGFNALPGVEINKDEQSGFPDFLTLPIRPPPTQPLPRTPIAPSNHHTDVLQMASENINVMTAALKNPESRSLGTVISEDEELDTRLWMLTALRCLKATSETGRKKRRPVVSSSGKIKVLSLYETDASAAFLSAHTPESQTRSTEIHHLRLTTAPATENMNNSSGSLPQLHPLSVPFPHLPLPYASHLFSQLHSQPLYCLLPSSALPTLLKECYRLLLPGGTLFLTILDPRPKVETMGPKLHAWLEQHLITNLERQFRCTTPSRLVPEFAAEAGFVTQPPPSSSKSDVSTPLDPRGLNGSKIGEGISKSSVEMAEGLNAKEKSPGIPSRSEKRLSSNKGHQKTPSWNYFPDISSDIAMTSDGLHSPRSTRTPSVSSSVKSRARSAKQRSRHKPRPVKLRITLPAILSPRGVDAPSAATITQSSFSSNDTPPSDTIDDTNTDKNTDSAIAELKVCVLRQLWLQQWGSFAKASTRVQAGTTSVRGDAASKHTPSVSDVFGGDPGACWWWEDESIVQECRERGTAWELLFMEAVKPL